MRWDCDVAASWGQWCEDGAVAAKGAREQRDLGDLVRDLSPELLLEIVVSCSRAVPLLKRARRAAEVAGQSDWFAARLADLREHRRRRPTLIAMLDKAGLA